MTQSWPCPFKLLKRVILKIKPNRISTYIRSTKFFGFHQFREKVNCYLFSWVFLFIELLSQANVNLSEINQGHHHPIWKTRWVTVIIELGIQNKVYENSCASVGQSIGLVHVPFKSITLIITNIVQIWRLKIAYVLFLIPMNILVNILQ